MKLKIDTEKGSIYDEKGFACGTIDVENETMEFTTRTEHISISEDEISIEQNTYNPYLKEFEGVDFDSKKMFTIEKGCSVGVSAPICIELHNEMLESFRKGAFAFNAPLDPFIPRGISPVKLALEIQEKLKSVEMSGVYYEKRTRSNNFGEKYNTISPVQTTPERNVDESVNMLEIEGTKLNGEKVNLGEVESVSFEINGKQHVLNRFESTLKDAYIPDLDPVKGLTSVTCNYDSNGVAYKIKRQNFPEILPTQKWNLIGYINGKHTNVYQGKMKDFKTLRFLGRSGDFFHVLGDDRTILVCNLIFK